MSSTASSVAESVLRVQILPQPVLRLNNPPLTVKLYRSTACKRSTVALTMHNRCRVANSHSAAHVAQALAHSAAQGGTH